MRRILHIDMDAFFASVELRRRPELAGRPLVIGGRGDPNQRGVVSTASYEARKFGIHSAMPLRTAYQLCPEAVFLPVDYKEYEKVSERIKLILKTFTPVIEDGGIDEAYLDISLAHRPSGVIAREIKDRIKADLGLTCSIGIAPNKLLAKMASDLQKPDGLTMITHEDVPERIWPLPVRKLYGVGPKTEERLKHMGIGVIGALASAPLQDLVRAFGPSHGSYLHRASRGIDERPLMTQWVPRSSSREVTFQQDTSDRKVLLETLARLTAEVTEEIAGAGFRARTVTVKVRFSDFATHTRGKTLAEATNDLPTIRETAMACFERFEWTKRVRLIGVRVGRLEKT